MSPHYSCYYQHLTKNLYFIYIFTSIATYQISSMTQGRIVKLIIICLNDIFMAETHRQPTRIILFNSESNLHWFITFFSNSGLHQSKVIVVGFSGFDQVIRDNLNSSMLELLTVFKLNFHIEDRRAIEGLL